METIKIGTKIISVLGDSQKTLTVLLATPTYFLLTNPGSDEPIFEISWDELEEAIETGAFIIQEDSNG